MDRNEVLKSCPNPWCISRTTPLPCALKREGWVVRCACGVVTFRKETEAEARALWNTRTSVTNEEVVSVLETALMAMNPLHPDALDICLRARDLLTRLQSKRGEG